MYVGQIPIPEASPGQRAAIEALVQKCLDARGQGPQVAEWEGEINQIVYELYNLTSDEIELIESSIVERKRKKELDAATKALEALRKS